MCEHLWCNAKNLRENFVTNLLLIYYSVRHSGKILIFLTEFRSLGRFVLGISRMARPQCKNLCNYYFYA